MLVSLTASFSTGNPQLGTITAHLYCRFVFGVVFASEICACAYDLTTEVRNSAGIAKSR